MKTRSSLLLLVFISGLIFISGCKKVTENMVDCLGESLLVSVRADVDASNNKLINFEAHYVGESSVSSVTWDFGDGSSQTFTTKTASHTYSKAGNYMVKAKVTLSQNGSTCTPEPTKSIVVD